MLSASIVFLCGFTMQVPPVKLSGTLVSGVAVYHDGNSIIGVESIPISCAAGKFDGPKFTCDPVWDKDVTGKDTESGIFHFYTPDELKEGVSIMYELSSEPAAVPQARFYSTSFDSKMVVRSSQDGKRYEVKARLVLRPTDVRFTTPQSAVQQIVQTVRAYRRLLQSNAISRKEGDERKPDEIARQGMSEEVIVVLSSLFTGEKYRKDEVLGLLREAVVKDARLSPLDRELIGFLMDNELIWKRGESKEAFEKQRQNWNAWRESRNQKK